MGDIPKEGVKKAKLWGTTDELRYLLRHMGVIQTMVCQLSKLLGCPVQGPDFLSFNLDPILASRIIHSRARRRCG
jgi:hypothetical protein